MSLTSAGRRLASTLVTGRPGPAILFLHSMIESYLRIAPRAEHRYLEGATHGLTEPAWEQAFRTTIGEWFAAL